MRILRGYISRSIVVSLVLAVVVFTTVLILGNTFRVVAKFSGKVSPVLLVRVIAYLMPSLLSYSLPLGLLVAVLLVFGRLSANNEVVAMRAGGISLWQILWPVLLLGVGVSAVCVPINTHLAPWGKWAVRQLPAKMPLDSPLELLEPGTFNDHFPGYLIYLERYEGNRAQGILCYQLDDANSVISKIEAREGVIEFDRDKLEINIELIDARIEQADPDSPRDVSRTRAGISARSWPVVLPLRDMLEKFRANPKRSDQALPVLLEQVTTLRARQFASTADETERRAAEISATSLLIEVNKRLALAFAPLAFVLIGLPLGIRAHRSETMVGIGISLLIAFTYYALLGFAESTLTTHPELRPEFMLWVPNLLCEILGILLLIRLSRA